MRTAICRSGLSRVAEPPPELEVPRGEGPDPRLRHRAPLGVDHPAVDRRDPGQTERAERDLAARRRAGDPALRQDGKAVLEDPQHEPGLRRQTVEARSP